METRCPAVYRRAGRRQQRWLSAQHDSPPGRPVSHSAARSSQQVKEEQQKEESHQHQHQHQHQHLHQQEYLEQEVRKSVNESVVLSTPYPHSPDDRRRRVSAAAGGRPVACGKGFRSRPGDGGITPPTQGGAEVTQRENRAPVAGFPVPLSPRRFRRR